MATLIADPARPCITQAVGAAAVAALGPGASGRWLDSGCALDIELRDVPVEAARERLRSVLGDIPLDVVVQPVAGRRKRLFLADMDSTMIEQECIDELADFVGMKGEVSRITERAMRGEIAFEPALRERVALLKGLPLAIVDRVMAERITFTSGGATLVATLRANGAYACLVSGGFTAFTAQVGAALGFDENRANRLTIEDEALAGRVEEPILGREAKFAALVELRDRLELAVSDVLAVGDGANDLAMLGEAGLGVAFRAKPAVAAAAHARIDHGDLTALLYLQGYARADFVEA